MTEDNDKRGPPPAPPKEGRVKQMTEDNDKRGPPPTPPKEGLGEVPAFDLTLTPLGTPLLWRGRGRWGHLFVNNFPYTVFQHMVF